MFKRLIAACLVASSLLGVPAIAAPLVPLPAQADTTLATTAYNDLIARFWQGDKTTGHFDRVAKGDPKFGAPVCKGCLWEYSMGVNVLYAQWKITKSADAQARLNAMWRWIKTTWSLQDVSTCGAGSTSTAEDDAAWSSVMFTLLDEPTRDPQTLAYAKGVIDCAVNRWSTPDGSLWYDDKRKNKTSYLAPLAWGMLDYSVKTGDQTYFERAVALDKFASTDLRTSRPADGLYWVNVGADSRPLDNPSPQAVRKGGSNIMLAGNMGFAALDARLYAITKTPAYKAKAVATAAGIFTKERIGAVLMNDRDASVDGWCAYQYATYVVPLLPAAGTADASTILATGLAVGTLDRQADGTYGADWDGQVSVWAKASPSFRLIVSSNAVVWPVVAQLYAH